MTTRPVTAPVSLPHPKIAKDTLGVLLAGAVYAFLFLFFWPVIYTTMDESAYLSLAYALSHGTVYLDVAHVTSVQSYAVGSHHVSQYPPGLPALLALPTLINPRLALGMNLVIHLATYGLVALLLRWQRVPMIFALLYLLHPTAVLFSRGVMSDPFAGFIIASAFAAFVRRRFVLVGVLIGLSLWVRTAGIIVAPLFVGAVLVEGTRFFPEADGESSSLAARIRRAIEIALPACAFFGFAWLYQKIIQDGGWARYAQPGMVSVRYFPTQFPFYAVALLVLYPLMLLAPLLYRGPARTALLFLTGGFLLFYSCYYFHDEGSSRAETFIVGQRFLLAVLPLFVVAYSRVLWDGAGQKIPHKIQIAASVLIAACLFVGAVVVHRKHSAYLASLIAVRAAATEAIAPGEVLICNVHLAKLMNPGWGRTQAYTLLPTSGSESRDTQAVVNKVRAEVNQHHSVVVATWSRAYRPETPEENQILAGVARAFPSAKELHPPNAPADVHLLRVPANATAR